EISFVMDRNPTTVRRGRSASRYTRPMPVILVLVDDPAARDPLVETLRRLFPCVRLVAARADVALPFIVNERATVVVAGLSAAEHVCRDGAPLGVPVVALTRDMSPDTLLRVESLGIAGALRAPTGADQLAAVIGPFLGPPTRRDHR